MADEFKFQPKPPQQQQESGGLLEKLAAGLTVAGALTGSPNATGIGQGVLGAMQLAQQEGLKQQQLQQKFQQQQQQAQDIFNQFGQFEQSGLIGPARAAQGRRQAQAGNLKGAEKTLSAGLSTNEILKRSAALASFKRNLNPNLPQLMQNLFNEGKLNENSTKEDFQLEMSKNKLLTEEQSEALFDQAVRKGLVKEGPGMMTQLFNVITGFGEGIAKRLVPTGGERITLPQPQQAAPPQAAAPQSGPAVGTRAVNPQTGETLIFDGQNWVPGQ
jgi:hypothetical protein